METPASPHDHVSQQTVIARPETRPAVQRLIVVRFNPRLTAALGALLVTLAAFLPWLDPAAQAVLGGSRVAPVIHSWPSLLIGLIALGVLALPHGDAGRWVSLPAAALGLAAAFIAVVSALTASNAVTAAISRFPTSDATPIPVTGTGVLVALAGGLLCVVAGLAQPPSTAQEVRFTLRPGEPLFTLLASSLVVVALIAGLIGAWIVSNQSGPSAEDQASVSDDLLSTPVIDVRVTPLGPTPDSAGGQAVPTLPIVATDPPLPTAPLPTPTFNLPTATATLASSLPGSPTPTPTRLPTFAAGPGDTETPTPSATFPPSPLDE
jgi:hypothetical protein